MDCIARLERLQRAMSGRELDGLVYGTGANLLYFTGLPVRWRRGDEPAEPGCFLVLARGRAPRLLLEASAATGAVSTVVEVEVVQSQRELPARLRSLLLGRRIGIGRRAGDYLRRLLAAALPGAECVDAEALGEELRLVKDPDEVRALRAVAALTDRVMDTVVHHIRPGITQPRLQALIAEVGAALGAHEVSFQPAALFVKSGTEPAPTPFVYPQEQGLEAGTSVAFDFGFVRDGYCSDFGRSFYCGPAPRHILDAYRALQQGHVELINRLRPGLTRLGELYGMLEGSLDTLGYGDRLRARLTDGTLGHQIGVDLHENPWVRPGCDLVLRPGMVMALEPKLWWPGEYYLRVEDMVLVTATGAESITGFDRELFELSL